MIGTYSANTKIWVSHGNKVLRCSPQQLRALTDDQRRAIGVVPVEMLATRPNSKRGAQVFTDITHEGNPPNEANEGDAERRPKKPRRRYEEIGEDDMSEEENMHDQHERQVTIGTEQAETQCPSTPAERSVEHERSNEQPDTSEHGG